MIIYKDYDTTSLLFNEPCEINGIGNVYPVLLKDYKKLRKYSHYLTFSKEYLGIGDDVGLLYALIIAFSQDKCRDAEKIDIAIMETLKEFADLFSIITRKEIIYNEIDNDFVFKSIDGVVTINSENFDVLRNVVLKMCLIKENKVFKNKEVEKWYYKGLKAAQRGKKEIDIDDVVSIVIQDMKYSFEYVYNLNIFQLYVLYARINNSIGYETISKFRCVGEVKSNLEFNDGVIASLYKDIELGDLLMSKEELAGMIS
ncbi:hypothetical protein [uncultured Clostridium sp.]|uniref:hypothetical protein n=1 Tax=uncultured Clostridium sp. TaxID=59620 RepID=UPI00261462E3|nr:hypothetical protein [uncultured Clostridium sp.]